MNVPNEVTKAVSQDTPAEDDDKKPEDEESTDEAQSESTDND